MSPSIAEEAPINSLITLKSQFEHELIEADAKAANLRVQIKHVDALLLHQLVPTNGLAPLQTQIETPTTELLLSAQIDTPTAHLDLTPAQAETETISTPAKGGRRRPRATLPAYQELTRPQAITTILLAHQGQALTADTLTKELFGTLNDIDHKEETKRLKATLYKGEHNKLWQKGKEPSSYLIKGAKGKLKGSNSKKVAPAKRGASTATNKKQDTPKATAKTGAKAKASIQKPVATTKDKAKVETTKAKRETTTTKATGVLKRLPPYKEMGKNEAIAAVLEKQAGKAVHRDAIIQYLYGELSSEDLKAERKRMTTNLYKGVNSKKWRKASAPLSYQMLHAAKDAKPKSPSQKAKAPNPQPKAAKTVEEKTPKTAATTGTEPKPKKGRKTTTSRAKTPVKTKRAATKAKA